MLDKYRDYFDIDPEYLAQINEAEIESHPDLWKKFYPHETFVKLIKDTDCNAVVVDIKDGVLAYKSEVAKEMSPRSYKTAYASVEEYKAGIDALRESGVYLIGRIVVFNDPIYAKDHPEQCIIVHMSSCTP